MAMPFGQKWRVMPFHLGALRMLHVVTGYSNNTLSCSELNGNTLVKVSDRYDTYLRSYERVKPKNVISRENLTFDLT